MVSPTDAVLSQLVRRARRQDPQAWRALYAQLADALYRYCYVRCGSDDHARHLVARVFQQMLKGITQLSLPRDQPAAVFIGWMLHMADGELDQSETQVSLIALGAAPRVVETQPGSGLARELLPLDGLAATLRCLPRDQQAVIILRQIEHLSAAEVAAVLHLDVQEVRTLHQAALTALGQSWTF